MLKSECKLGSLPPNCKTMLQFILCKLLYVFMMQAQKFSITVKYSIYTFCYPVATLFYLIGDVPLCWDNWLSVWPELCAKSYEGKRKKGTNWHQIFRSYTRGIQTAFLSLHGQLKLLILGEICKLPNVGLYATLPTPIQQSFQFCHIQ